MDSKQLVVLLAREGFNPIGYRIETVNGGQGWDDCYCLRHTLGAWEVSYVERGSRQVLGTFDTEAAACDDLLARLEREPNARSHLLASFSWRSEADAFVAELVRSGIQPTHRDAPAFAHPGDIRHRVFVDGRDLERARKIRPGLPGVEAG